MDNTISDVIYLYPIISIFARFTLKLQKQTQID